MIMDNNELARACEGIVARYDLLEHPFYKAWSDGTLPIEALRDYAGEYGAFIATIGKGWSKLGRNDISSHEAAHARVWDTSFAVPLGTVVQDPQVPAVKDLVRLAGELFESPSTAVGALYAFESQQPRTAASKLKGLKENYQSLPSSCGDYFHIHSGDYDE